MRRRLYFILPDVRTAQTVEKELLLEKIEDQHMHFLAKEGIDLGRLHVANLLQRTDLLHGMGIGLVAGGLTGAVAGAALHLFPDIGAMVGMGGVLVLAVIGALVGTWASGMIAISAPNSLLSEFQNAINRGQILLMVDVPVRRVREVREKIMRHHPEAENRGVDTHMPAFP